MVNQNQQVQLYLQEISVALGMKCTSTPQRCATFGETWLARWSSEGAFALHIRYAYTQRKIREKYQDLRPFQNVGSTMHLKMSTRIDLRQLDTGKSA